MKIKTVRISSQDEAGIRNRIRHLLEEVTTNTDPYLLNQYRSIFRSEVSFFRRSYVAAYLLMMAEGKQQGRGRSVVPGRDRKGAFKETRKDQGGRNRQEAASFGRQEKRPPQEEPPRIPDEEASRLFISIGRNRKVFPREILGFIMSKTQDTISRDDVGLIRVLDNYSFIQVRTSAAEAIIAALNGQNFRGRTLTVNYARSRAEGTETAEGAVEGYAENENGEDEGGGFSA